MKPKAFGVVTFIAMILAFVALIIGVFGVIFSGFYPAVIVLLLLVFIPVCSRIYPKKVVSNPSGFQPGIYRALTFLNLIIILTVVWMSFVILIDRVIPNF